MLFFIPLCWVTNISGMFASNNFLIPVFLTRWLETVLFSLRQTWFGSTYFAPSVDLCTKCHFSSNLFPRKKGSLPSSPSFPIRIFEALSVFQTKNLVSVVASNSSDTSSQTSRLASSHPLHPQWIDNNHQIASWTCSPDFMSKYSSLQSLSTSISVNSLVVLVFLHILYAAGFFRQAASHK